MISRKSERSGTTKKDPEASGKDPNIEMTFAFRSGLQVGDYVVISDGRDSYRAFGKVSGEYEFDPTPAFIRTGARSNGSGAMITGQNGRLSTPRISDVSRPIDSIRT